MGGNTTSSTQKVLTEIMNKVSAEVITNNVNKSSASAANKLGVNVTNTKVCGNLNIGITDDKQSANIDLQVLASSATRNNIATEMVSGIMTKLEQMQKNGSLQTGIKDNTSVNQDIKNKVENIISTKLTTNNWNSCATSSYNQTFVNINDVEDCGNINITISEVNQVAESISKCKLINGVSNDISNAIHNVVESEGHQVQINTGMLQDLFNGVSKVIKNLPLGGMSLGSLTSMGNPASSMGSSIFCVICCCCLCMALLGLMLAAGGHKGKKSSGSYGPQSIEMTPMGGPGSYGTFQ